MSVATNANVEDTEQRRLLFVDLIAEFPDDETRKNTLEKLENYIDILIEENQYQEEKIDDLNHELGQS